MKKNWIDNLRIAATLAIIVHHVAGNFVFDIDFTLFSTWWLGLFTIGLMRYCVPVFVMISGALLLPKQYSLKEHLKKRFVRVVLPLLFWSMVYIMIDLLLPVIKGEPITLISSIKYVASSLIFGASWHLWYIYMILGLYLFIPIIQKWILNHDKIEMHYFLLLWIITLIINWFIPSTPDEKGYDFISGVDLMYFSGFLGYLVLGYYLSVTDIFNGRRGNYYSLMLIIGGLLVTYIGTYMVSKAANGWERNFIRELTPNIALTGAGVFLLFKNHFNKIIKQRHIHRGMQMISKYSYGIYLNHAIPLILLNHFGINRNFIHPVLGIIITSIIGYIMALFLTMLINKLPYGKYISG